MSGVLRASAATALAAAVRRVVTTVPSMIAAGRPVTGSRTTIRAATVGSPPARLAGFTLPNLETAPLRGDRRAA